MATEGGAEEPTRTPEYRRNELLEALLQQLNRDLEASEREAARPFSRPALPVVLLVGALRSGTTLVLQSLAGSGQFSYPSNLLSRFYGAPILGARIQLLLTDPRYAFRDELEGLAGPLDFSSDLGKTRGALSPNEFYYFWRRFLPDPSRDSWTDTELRAGFDSRTMLAEIAGIEDTFGKPFAAKGLLFSYNIAFLNEIFPKPVFVHVRRDPLMNIQSALRARERHTGRRDTWYSLKIPEYEALQGLDPVSQVAAQVACINRAVAQGLAQLAPERQLTVDYEAFCARPQAFLADVSAKLAAHGCSVDAWAYAPQPFQPSNQLLLSKDEARTAMAVYEKYLEHGA